MQKKSVENSLNTKNSTKTKESLGKNKIKKKNLPDYSIDKLFLYLQATKNIIEKYEKISKNYDNRLVEKNALVFHKYVKLYNMIILELENKIANEIEF